MAELVATMAVAHAPGVTGWLESAPVAEQKEILAGYAELGRKLRATRPDLIVGIANDHMLNMPIENPPDFCVGVAEAWSGPAEFFRDWLKLAEYHVRGHAAAGRAIYDACRDAGVRVTSAQELLFDDNWSVPLTCLTPDYDVPLVPIQMNCINPPVPTPARSYEAGAAIGRAIREKLPKSMRVALIGTGGLSHEPGGKRYFTVDETFDRWFLDLLATGDQERILREASFEKMEAAGGGGTAELLAWVCVMAAAVDKKAKPVFYVPSVEMRCGIGGVYWDLAA
jgi:protocatechuate 4,5-dioxygenase beta chain